MGKKVNCVGGDSFEANPWPENVQRNGRERRYLRKAIKLPRGGRDIPAVGKLRDLHFKHQI